MFIETLECRELLSASPIHTRASAATIAADQAAITTARTAIPLARETWNATLKDDRAQVPAVRAADQGLIKTDRTKISQDRGNAVLVQTDQGQLLVDQGKLKTDVATAQATLKMDQGDAKIAIAADQKTLNEAIQKLKIDRLLK